MNQMKIVVTKFYPEEIRNITYRVEHNGKTHLKPPFFRVHSNKKAGIKPKLVPSIVFRDPEPGLRSNITLKKKLRV